MLKPPLIHLYNSFPPPHWFRHSSSFHVVKLFWSADTWLWTKVALLAHKLDIEYFKLGSPAAFQEFLIKTFSPEMGIIGFRKKVSFISLEVLLLKAERFT